jgi:hypothetical protein
VPSQIVGIGCDVNVQPLQNFNPLVSGLRDRALIAAMLYSVAQVSAVLKLKFDDYYHNRGRRRLRLHKKRRQGARDARESPA